MTPSTVRLDLKCGKGAISQGEKCHKGPATKVAVGAALALAAGAGAALLAVKHRPRGNTSSRPPGREMDLLAEGARGKVWVGKDKKTVTKSAKDKKAAQALFEEARLQNKAHNAGVSTPKVTSTNSRDNTIVMENLQDYKPLSTAAKSASLKQREEYAKDLVVNLSKAHAADIAHGDLNTNVLAKDGKLSIIDWGQASKVRYKGMADVLNAIRIADELNPGLAKTMKQEFKPLQSKFSKRETLTVADFNNFYSRVLRGPSRTDGARLDLKCGKGAISKGEKCHKGTPANLNAAQKTLLTAGALGLGAGLLKSALGRGRSVSQPIFSSQTPQSPFSATKPRSPQPSGGPVTPVQVRVEQPRLQGFTPRGLLAPAAPRPSKTQRMRANTASAIRKAEGHIAQTAREEVRRIAQIGNTMAATGEATGMAVKTAGREIRLRTEAARRRFEPGYRRPDQRQLPGGIQAALPEINLTPERVRLPVDPRTGQPSRRATQGFGRRDSFVQHYASVQLQPPTRRDAADGKKYSKTVTNPETGRPNMVRYGAKGYRIAPGTDKGDRYCARSFGDMKSEGYDCSGAERNTPLCLSRAKWKCSGKASRRDEGLTPGKSSAW